MRLECDDCKFIDRPCQEKCQKIESSVNGTLFNGNIQIFKLHNKPLNNERNKIQILTLKFLITRKCL